MKKTILLTLAFAVSVLLFTSCEKETPSVGSSSIIGSWECIEAPSNSDALFIKGDIISFARGRYELVHPDGKMGTGAFYLTGIHLELTPDGNKAILFNVKHLTDTNLALSQNTGMSFNFKKK